MLDLVRDKKSGTNESSVTTTRTVWQGAALLFLLLLILPVVLSTSPKSAAMGLFAFLLIFAAPGYLLLAAFGRLRNSLWIVLAPVLGIATVTTTYNILALTSITKCLFYLLIVLACAVLILVALQLKNATLPVLNSDGLGTLVAGTVVSLLIAPLFWRSGRLWGSDFNFYGPTGQDPLFHVTLLQRLLHHVPPDNFIVSGLRAPVYHYFDDLTLAATLRVQDFWHLGTTDLFDLYYRCYPLLLYFLLGGLAYSAGRRLVGSLRGGILAILLLLGAGGLGWFFGGLQTAIHASHFAAMRTWLFSTWTFWDGVDAILPLVHRPAHAHGLLISLAALNILLRPERSRRDWVIAGLLLGLMAGFNFTLAAIFGIASVLGCLILFFQHQRERSHELAWLAVFIFIGSLSVNAMMLWSGFHNPAPGFPFRGPNLEFTTAIWGPLLSRLMPVRLVPCASLILFPIVAYGVKLFGLPSMARLDLGEDRHRGIALVLAIVFVFSLLVGTFFPYNALGGQGIIFIQPTLWILALLSLRPIDAWLQRNRKNWRAMALWGILGLTWMQALGSFHFSNKVAFSQDAVSALEDVRSSAAPDDVVAYLPTNLTSQPILGHSSEFTNFATMALTGLDGYFSSTNYSKFFAVPGLSGHDSADVLTQAENLYKRRNDDVESFLQYGVNADVQARLLKDHVRWIVVSGPALQHISSSLVPWRRTRDMAVFRVFP